VSSYCEAGCCEDACCGETEISPITIAVIVCSVVGGLFILFFAALAIYCCLCRRRWCMKNADEERAKKPKKKKKEKKVKPKEDKKVKKIDQDDKPKNWVINGKWDWHGWKKQEFGEDSRQTQTENHKLQPGDYILWSKSRWFPVKKDKNAIKDPRTNIKEVGVNTEDLAKIAANKWKKTAATKTQIVVEPTPMPKPVAPTDHRVASPSQVQPYYPTSKQSGKASDDDGYRSQGKSSVTPLSTSGREDTMDSLRDFTHEVLNETEGAKGDGDIKVINDPNREERDRLNKLKASGYVSTWQFPEVKRWNPHSKGVDPKNSKWAKAHDYAKNINANKQE